MKFASALLSLVVTAVAASGIAVVQPGLARTVHGIRQRDEDVMLLPPPRQLRAMTLGYHAASTDLLWAKLVLEYGLHNQEKRPFANATRYLDAILALEPTFPTLYQFVDTLLLYTPGKIGPAEARLARSYLERGTLERPYDPDIWLRLGQFCAFLAPTFLTDKAEIDRWRVEGAQAMTRAVELGSDASKSLSATSILTKSGERRATIDHLQRVYAVTDDAAVREQILLRLQQLESDAGIADAAAVVEREWQTRYGFLPRGVTLLVGPYRSAAKCAGPASYERRGCASDWTGAIAERR